MNDWFLRGDYGTTPTNYATFLIATLLAFVCGHVIAWIYMLTHSGLSYSRSYVNSLIILPVIVALVMMVLSNNLVIAFGLMAIFAMVRFRTVLRLFGGIDDRVGDAIDEAEKSVARENEPRTDKPNKNKQNINADQRVKHPAD